MASQERLDLVVGIDFGQTCSGVAYNNLSHGSNNIRWVQKWPGRLSVNENKVPSMVLYPRGHDQPCSWGFKAAEQAEHYPSDLHVREWFKTLLDPQTFERQKNREPDLDMTPQDVRQWLRDYLRLLYDHIETRLKGELPGGDWSAGRIEFLFSVPTTWSPTTVEDFRTVTGQAGFGGPVNAHHTVTVSLTEPEAAAVYTSTEAVEIFKPNDILVVCDAGGGTTDLCALRVTDTSVGALSLKQLSQLDVVKGENVGSAAIDYEFEQYVRQRLDKGNILGQSGFDSANAAWEMAKTRSFQNAKCEHGSYDAAPTFAVRVPRVPEDFESPDADIRHGEMYFRKEELDALFDTQIEKLFTLLDDQFLSLANKLPDEQISHLIFSGGLAQSEYVKNKIQEQYVQSSDAHRNASSLQFRVAPDPQLAVCKGLVADRIRKLKAGKGVLGWRCCRASYGLICKELYDKNKKYHIGRRTEKDPRDGKSYVPDCVDWLIEKGMPVNLEEPIVHSFRRKISPGDPARIFPTKVVISYNEREELPHHLGPGVEKLCEIKTNLSDTDAAMFKEKNSRLWDLRKSYYEVTYDVRVLIGPADLRFQLYFNGQRMSSDNDDPIKVEWAATTAPSAPILQTAPQRHMLEEDGIKQKDSSKTRWWRPKRDGS